jgi:hypothetical protein
MSTRFLQNHNGVGGVASNQVAVVPPDLSPLEDVKLINYNLQTDTIANTITNATIYDLNLSWKKSSNVSETFYYQIWINDDLTAPDNNTDSLYAFEDINITDNVTVRVKVLLSYLCLIIIVCVQWHVGRSANL